MPSYLVESYGAGSVVEDQRRRARLAAELGTGVRYVRTTFLPGDETLLHLFEATSPDALRRAARNAALAYERIVEAGCAVSSLVSLRSLLAPGERRVPLRAWEGGHQDGANGTTEPMARTA